MEVLLQDKKLAIIDAAIAVAKGELQIRACKYELEVRKLIKTIPVDEIAIVQTIIDGIEFHQPGKRPIIDSLHITILAKRMNEMNLCGVGLDMKGMSAFVRIRP